MFLFFFSFLFLYLINYSSEVFFFTQIRCSDCMSCRIILCSCHHAHAMPCYSPLYSSLVTSPNGTGLSTFRFSPADTFLLLLLLVPSYVRTVLYVLTTYLSPVLLSCPVLSGDAIPYTLRQRRL